MAPVLQIDNDADAGGSAARRLGSLQWNVQVNPKADSFISINIYRRQ